MFGMHLSVFITANDHYQWIISDIKYQSPIMNSERPHHN